MPPKVWVSHPYGTMQSKAHFVKGFGKIFCKKPIFPCIHNFFTIATLPTLDFHKKTVVYLYNIHEGFWTPWRLCKRKECE